jgi:hypothetical protein
MKITLTMFKMFVGCFVIQYFLIPPIMVNNYLNVTNNIGKIYLTIIACLFFTLLETMLHDHKYNVLSLNIYLITGAILILFIYLYRKQIGVNDEQYLKSLIEQQSNGIFMSESILKKTNNYNVAKIAKNVLQTQKDEIKEFEQVLLNLKNTKKYQKQ